MRANERPLNQHVLSDEEIHSLTLLAQTCRRKQHFYECCVRHGYHLPAPNSRIIGVKYLEGVRAGTVYCP